MPACDHLDLTIKKVLVTFRLPEDMEEPFKGLAILRTLPAPGGRLTVTYVARICKASLPACVKCNSAIGNTMVNP
jgi:hypothetical protein